MDCGARKYVLGAERVCELPAGHEPPHQSDTVIWVEVIPEIPLKVPGNAKEPRPPCEG